jgi:hypothetical protein
LYARRQQREVPGCSTQAGSRHEPERLGTGRAPTDHAPRSSPHSDDMARCRWSSTQDRIRPDGSRHSRATIRRGPDHAGEIHARPTRRHRARARQRGPGRPTGASA